MSKQHVYFVDTKLIAYYLFQRGSSIYGLYDKIAQILYNMPKGKVYLGWDIDKSSYRTAILPTYKAHRAKTKAKLSPEEQQAYKEFNENYIKLALFSDNFQCTNLAVPGVEADDLISLRVEEYKNNDDYEVVLVTNDYDYFHMVVGTSNVKLFAVYDGIMLDHNTVVDRYKLDSRRKFSILKSIQGDDSDNIKFCMNIGPVKALEIYNKIYMKYKDPTNDECIKVIEKYLEDKEKARIERELKTSISVHPDHIAAGNTTPRDAFLANLSIADPFTDTTLMTSVQTYLYNEALSRVYPPKINDSDLLQESAQIFGTPLSLGYKACKIFGIN